MLRARQHGLADLHFGTDIGLLRAGAHRHRDAGVDQIDFAARASM